MRKNLKNLDIDLKIVKHTYVKLGSGNGRERASKLTKDRFTKEN